MHRRWFTTLSTVVLLMPSAAASSDEATGCLGYEPTNVTLRGSLERRTYPGRPNFESIKKGDEPETGYYLRLSRPVCTDGDSASADAYPQQDGRLVQLVLEEARFKRLKPMLGRSGKLSGT